MGLPTQQKMGSVGQRKLNGLRTRLIFWKCCRFISSQNKVPLVPSSGGIAASLIMTIAADFARPETINTSHKLSHLNLTTTLQARFIIITIVILHMARHYSSHTTNWESHQGLESRERSSSKVHALKYIPAPEYLIMTLLVPFTTVFEGLPHNIISGVGGREGRK